MMFNVPQFIDVEDKIAGPLTWRQILWMIGMGATLLTFYNLFDSTLFFIISVPTVLLFAAFAFYRPNGMSMTAFFLHAVFFFFRPKVSVWERPATVRRMPQAPKTSENGTQAPPAAKDLSEDRLHELAKILDRHGRV